MDKLVFRTILLTYFLVSHLSYAKFDQNSETKKLGSHMVTNQEPIHRSSGLPSNIAAITPADVPQLKIILEEIKESMDDWPQLHYYSKANAQIMHGAQANERVVFLGDSITEFWNDQKYGGFFPGKPYINRGISAQTTPQMLLRLRADVIALKPKVMVLLAGVNDIAGNTGPMTMQQTQDNITTIAELATLHHIKVIIASVLPTSNYHYNGTEPITVRRPLATIRALNAWIKNYCEEHGHVYLDYFTAMIDEQGMLKSELSEDDLHPNKTGYALMAPLAQAAIEKAFKS